MSWFCYEPSGIVHTKKILKEIWQLALSYLDTRMSTLHAEIARDVACTLIKKGGVEEDVVIRAIILHDAGWKAMGYSDSSSLRSKPQDALNEVDKIFAMPFAG
jgi:hypothetical protein